MVCPNSLVVAFEMAINAQLALPSQEAHRQMDNHEKATLHDWDSGDSSLTTLIAGKMGTQKRLQLEPKLGPWTRGKSKDS